MLNIKQQIYKKREELFSNIAKRYKIPLLVKLVPKENIPNGAEGCYESDIIKIRRNLPLFWQLIVLEHEIGHYWAQKQNIKAKRKTFHVYRKTDDSYQEEEIKAWEWVEDHPVTKGGIIDQELHKYLENIANIASRYGDFATCLQWAFWF